MPKTNYWRVLQLRHPTSISADIAVQKAPKNKTKTPRSGMSICRGQPRDVAAEVAETLAAKEALGQEAGEPTDWRKVMAKSRKKARRIRSLIDQDDGWRPGNA